MRTLLLVIGLTVIMTLPCRAQVQEAWEALYDIPGKTDRPSAIEVDVLGNVFVTGRSGTVKYDSNGNELWTGKYGGVAIKTDPEGYSYVTSPSWILEEEPPGPVSHTFPVLSPIMDIMRQEIYHDYYKRRPDYVTVKYDPNGNVCWVDRYDGLGVYFQPDWYYLDDDVPADLVVDHEGNVIVTGYSGVDWDIRTMTIKYDNDGNEIWSRSFYNDGYGPSAMDVDGFGNIYIASCDCSGGTNTYFIITKYDPEGNNLYVDDIYGSGASSPSDINVDEEGNIAITGWTSSTSRPPYNTVGILTAKLDYNGDKLWESVYSEPGAGWADAYDVDLDEDGNIYVTGYADSTNDGSNRDIITIKYDLEGDELWVARYDGSAQSNDKSYSLTIDGDGNVYVAGYSTELDTDRDYIIIKYSTDGDEKWIARHDVPENENDEAYDIAMDQRGNIYVTGNTTNYDDRSAYLTIKYRQNPLIHKTPILWNR